MLHRAGEGTDKQARQRVRSHTRAPDQITPFRGRHHRRCRFVSELFANEGDSMPQGHLATHRPFLMLATACWGGGGGVGRRRGVRRSVRVCVLLAFSEGKPGRLLNTLQGTERPPRQRIIQLKMPTAPRLRDPVLNEKCIHLTTEAARPGAASATPVQPWKLPTDTCAVLPATGPCPGRACVLLR